MEPDPNHVVSNRSGQRRMLEVVRAALATSDQIAISVSFLRCSGLGLVANDLRSFGDRGGVLRFLTSTYMGITQPDALRALRSFSGVECRVHTPGAGGSIGVGFHTKLYVFDGDRDECWVGSSNFSKGGLATNLEANLRHVGQHETTSVRRLFDLLWQRPDVISPTDAFLAAYAAAISSQAAPKHFHFPTTASNLGSSPLDAGYSLDTIKPEYRIGSEAEPVPSPNVAQLEAMVRLNELRKSGESRAAIVAAPGVGKTYLAAFDALAAQATSVLFLSHRLEHLTQAERTFRVVFGEKFSYGLLYGGKDVGAEDLVFSTIASASGSDLVHKRSFDYVVVDEFHHAAAPSYQNLLSRIRPKFLLGLTATPERQDGHDVLRLCDFNVAYEVRLPEAINRGWLLPFHYFGVSDDEVDYERIPWRSGGFDPVALENALMVQARVDQVLAHCRERGFDGPRRATVGFCAGVKHAKFMAAELRNRGLIAEAITGDVSVEERERIYARFQNPRDNLEWLFVADVLNEGVDIPAINSIVFLRPTQSATVFIQQLGRGLRLTSDCEVLTVVDLVGLHRAAWLPIEALGDKDAPRGPSTVAALGLTPPVACEVVLDDRTLQILEKIKNQEMPKRQRCLDAYRALKDESGVDRPMPVDMLSINSSPSIGEVRAAFGSWLGLRRAAGDALPWEESMTESQAGFRLLAAAERDWQAQRVYGYAALWGMCANPEDIESGYRLFFERFPRWNVEFKAFRESKVSDTLVKKLGDLFDGSRISKAAFSDIPAERLLHEIEGRLLYVLDKDFRQRHGGTLRTPEDLVLHRRYDRPEIVNHFGSQYDPARHNSGLIRFGENSEKVAILAKLDTSDAITRHQYSNSFDGLSHFVWTSQNRQRQDNASGRSILDHTKDGRRLFLFVQPTSHSKSIYCGEVSVVSAEGNEPMTVRLALKSEITPDVMNELTGAQ